MTKEKYQQISDRLSVLREENGRLSPEIVVNDARNPSSPLHDMFEWDVDKAAYSHWIERAREILRTVKVKVTIEERTLTVPKYVHDPYAKNEQGYEDVLVIRNSKQWSSDAVDLEIARLRAAIKKAHDMAVLYGYEDRFFDVMNEIVRHEVPLGV